MGNLSKEEKEALRLEFVFAYRSLIDALFKSGFTKGATLFSFKITEVEETINYLKIEKPDNLKAVMSSFKSREDFSNVVLEKTPEGKRWAIKATKGKVDFELADDFNKEKMYEPILSHIFSKKYKLGDTVVEFARKDITTTAGELSIDLPANLGDLVYAFRYRQEMPEVISKVAPEGQSWIIMGSGRAQYQFLLGEWATIAPQRGRERIKTLDDTPETIRRYTLKDEQACLARIRYNRLVDQFLGIKASSLQNHLRTFVKDVGQVEIDELYVGVDRYGAHYVVPVQAKVGADKHSIVQTLQDSRYCDQQHPRLEQRCISAQYIRESYQDEGRSFVREVIVMFLLIVHGNEVSIRDERHYELVDSRSLSEEDLDRYRASIPLPDRGPRKAGEALFSYSEHADQ
ncbi:MAG: hypothetical protein EOP06_03995 [Proteobacteria bacterium]|nr:MAG: hypothetical protein EOP06_03995 [Pseudomonadota bacterium]